MTSAAKKVVDDALALPEADRRRVVERLLDSMPRETAEELEKAWVDEATRRAAEVERGEGELLDLDEALTELREDLSRIHRG